MKTLYLVSIDRTLEGATPERLFRERRDAIAYAEKRRFEVWPEWDAEAWKLLVPDGEPQMVLVIEFVDGVAGRVVRLLDIEVPDGVEA